MSKSLLLSILTNVILVLFFLYVKREGEIKKNIQEEQRDLLRWFLEKQIQMEEGYAVFNYGRRANRTLSGTENQEKLIAFIKELLEKQVLLLRQSDHIDDMLIPIEISRYLKDFLLDQVAKGEISPVAKRRVHGKVVKMYPELFKIFD